MIRQCLIVTKSVNTVPYKLSFTRNFYRSLSNKSKVEEADLRNNVIITEKFKQLREDYQKPKYPLVLCHGFFGFDKLILLPKLKHFQTKSNLSENVGNAIQEGFLSLNYWYGIQEAIEKLGCTVLVGKVPPLGTIEERATCLNDFIDKKCAAIQKSETKSSLYNLEDMTKEQEKKVTSDMDDGKIKVNLISHSMGGLDARYLISKLNQKNFSVASLTTISTPHHGSEFADFIVDFAKKRPYLEKLCQKGVFQLTTSYLKEFNEQVVNDPKVTYFSYGAMFNPRWFNVFNLTWKVIKKRIALTKKEKKELESLIANDGMVSVESSKWGEYLGTLKDVDHLDLINWTNRLRLVFDKALFNKTPTFNAIALYLDICDKLAKRGF